VLPLCPAQETYEPTLLIAGVHTPNGVRFPNEQ
jgi:hypothetical protein